MPELKFDKRLEAKIKTLSSYYQKIAQQKELLELLRLIRRPGWTTPAERLLVHGYIDSLSASASSLLRSTEGMLRGAREVGRER